MDTADDSRLGPQLTGRFDFTLLFEHSVLSIPLSVLGIIAFAIRLRWLSPHDVAEPVRRGWRLWLKTSLAVALLCLQVAQLSLWSVDAAAYRPFAVAASSLSLLAAAFVVTLVYLQHRRSLRPSVFLGTYFFFSILVDIPQLRSLFLRTDLHFRPLASIFCLSVVAKICLLALEETPKVPTTDESWKRAPPEAVGGAVNRSVLWWLNDTMILGYRQLIDLADLGPIQSKFDSSSLLARIDSMWKNSKQSRKHGLFLSIMRALLFEVIVVVPPRLALIGFKFAQPFLIKRIIETVGSQTSFSFDGDISRSLVAATALVYIGIAVSTCLYTHLTIRLLTCIRGALVGLIFVKMLSLSSYTDAAPVTLMSTDVDGIVSGMRFTHDIWACVVELAIGMFLLYREIGPPCFLVFIPILASTWASEVVSAGVIPAKMAWNLGVQKRVSATSAMLGQMKGIKVMGLVPAFSSRIQALRQDEIKMSQKYRIFMTSIFVIGSAVTLLTPAIIITAAVYWTTAGNSQGLSIAQAFTALTIVALVSEPLSQLVEIRALFNSSLACFQRIQEFLILAEKQNYQPLSLQSPDTATNSPTIDKDGKGTANTMFELHELQAGRPSPQPAETQIAVKIVDATFQTREGTEILKQINFEVANSTVHAVTGPVGSGKTSLLLAILGELDTKQGSSWMNPVAVAFCSQNPWLRNVSIRDNIVAGAEFDAAWYYRVISACGLDKDFATVSGWDLTPVGSQALSLSGGQKQRVALARAVYSRNRILLLDDVFSGLDNKTASFVSSQLLGPNGLLRRPEYTVIMTTSSHKFLRFAQAITALEGGTIVSVPPYVMALKGHSITSNLLDSESTAEPLGPSQDDDIAGRHSDTVPQPIPPDADPDISRQAGDSSLYKMYLQSVGWAVAAAFLVSIIIDVAASKMPQIWLRVWTEHGTVNDRALYYGIYMMFSLAGPLLEACALALFTLLFIPRSAANLHLMLLKTVLKAPLYFFASTDSGVILNRFSQDMTLVDQQLPMAFFGTVLILVSCVISGGIIAAGGKYTAAYIPFILVILYLIQKFYLRTSRQLRHLDLEAKSPLYTHFTETLAGGATIRAFGLGLRTLLMNHTLLDNSQRPFYLLFAIQRWLNLVLDLVVAAVAIIMVAMALLIPGASSSGAIALSLFTLLTFSMELTALITVWTSLETSLGAIARLKSFVADTPDENKEGEEQDLPEDWPGEGAIKFDGIVASYRDELEPCLKNVTLDIKAGAKVALCGRTGSGKSSTLLALLRLIEIQSGALHIDGVELSTARRQAIRSGVTALPQDPVVIPGSIRENLDPEGRHIGGGDEVLTVALQKVQLWETVRERGGLDAEFNASSFSAGQQQLMCLARCLLNRSKVVLLDEAMSNVDHETDGIVQAVLRNEFGGSTVVEVLHRLDAIMDYDQVIVMHDGVVAEVGKPADLLESADSMLRGIWDARHIEGDP